MICTNKGIVRIVAGVVVLLPVLAAVVFSAARADQSLLVYPSSPAVLHYDTDCYEVITPGHPNYNPAFAVNGRMLWDKMGDCIPLDVYRAPQIVGFEVSTSGVNEFRTLHNNFDIIIDGYGPYPRVISNLYLSFLPTPYNSTPQMYMEGELLASNILALPRLAVTTEVSAGVYADTMRKRVLWSGAVSLRITAYSDKDFNGIYDGRKPRWAIVADDNTVPVTSKTWGAIKAIYR